MVSQQNQTTQKLTVQYPIQALQGKQHSSRLHHLALQTHPSSRQISYHSHQTYH
uniref:Uncharacterized protein n=1 Tax=Arundo donax TaxID=35708 RepID=A0A0A8YCW7_ARUDO